MIQRDGVVSLPFSPRLMRGASGLSFIHRAVHARRITAT